MIRISWDMQLSLISVQAITLWLSPRARFANVDHGLVSGGRARGREIGAWGGFGRFPLLFSSRTHPFESRSPFVHHSTVLVICIHIYVTAQKNPREFYENPHTWTSNNTWNAVLGRSEKNSKNENEKKSSVRQAFAYKTSHYYVQNPVFVRELCKILIHA